MNFDIILMPSLLPPVCDPLWFTAGIPKNEEAELAALEEELEQEKIQLKEQGFLSLLYLNVSFYCRNLILSKLAPEWYSVDGRPNTEANEDEQDYDETEDDSYMGDVASEADLEPASPTW